MQMKLKTLICALLIGIGIHSFAYSNTAMWSNDLSAVYKDVRCEHWYNGVYIKGFGGVNFARQPKWNHAQYRTGYGYTLGGALGCQLKLVSLEGEFSYRSNTVDHLKVDLLDIHVKGDIEQLCGFGNVLLNIPINNCFNPYAGIGVGYRHIKPGVNFDESSDTSLRKFVDSANDWGVYQLIGGFNFDLSRVVSIQLEYRYMDGWSNAKCSNHTADLGAVIHF